MSGSVVAKVIGLTTPLKLMSTAPQVDREFTSSIAARKVHLPIEFAHIPSPGEASPRSPLSFTVRTVGQLLGVGLGVGVGVAPQANQLSFTVPASPPHPSTTILYVVPAVAGNGTVVVVVTP